MKTKDVIRWSGLIAILGGVLFPIASIIHPKGLELSYILMPN